MGDIRFAGGEGAMGDSSEPPLWGLNGPARRAQRTPSPTRGCRRDGLLPLCRPVSSRQRGPAAGKCALPGLPTCAAPGAQEASPVDFLTNGGPNSDVDVA